MSRFNSNSQKDIKGPSNGKARVNNRRVLGGNPAGALQRLPQTVSPQNILQLQRMVGNQTVQRLLQKQQSKKQPRHPITINPTTKPANIQRQITWRYNKENQKEKKLVKTFKLLKNSSSTWGLLGGSKDFAIFITIDDSADPNPAEVSQAYTTGSGKDMAKYVRVGIRRWFVEKYSVGTAIGMLNHEIGVHVMPYLDKILENLYAEREGKEPPHAEKDLSAKEKAGIDDHRRAIDTGTSEFKQYLGMVFTTAETLAHHGKNDEAADVLFTYLMDIAAMAENGSKGKIARLALIPNPWQAQTITYVTNRYNDMVGELSNYVDNSPIKSLFYSYGLHKITEKQVRQEFATLRSNLPLARYTVQTAKENPKKTLVAVFLMLYLLYIIFSWLRSW